MARLPVPGSDDGRWGQVLNDFLSVSLDDDGEVRPIPTSKITGLQQSYVRSNEIRQMISMTQTEYDGLSTYDPEVLYVIVG